MSTYRVPEFTTYTFQQPVLDKDLNTPPATTKGNRYIVGPSPTDAWVGQTGNIATGNGSGWDFVTKKEGMLIYIKDEDKFYKYISSWTEYIGQAGPTGATGVSGTVTRGTFDNDDLSTGKLTITHTLGLSAPYSLIIAIYDNNYKQILPDEITGSTNSHEVDLTSYGVLSGTWGYVYVN